MVKTTKDTTTRQNKRRFLIGETPRQAGPCPNTIKKYIGMGVVKDVRDERGRRIFSAADIAKLKAYYLARNPEREVC